MTPESWISSLLSNGWIEIPAEMNIHATTEEPISKQRIGNHTTIGVLLETVFSIRLVQIGYIE
jgi:hypothetical protein